MTTTENSAFAKPRKTRHAVRRIDRLIGAAAGILAACCALGIAIGAWWITGEAARPETDITVTLGASRLSVPLAWLSTGPASLERSVEHLALRLSWSDLTGEPGPASPEDSMLFVTLMAADGSMPPPDRPALLYARFLSEDAGSAAGGLIRRSFRPGTPYEGEALMVAPPDGRSFAARCLEARPPGETGATCLAELRLAKRDVQVRFAPPLLGRWETLVGGLQRRFGEPQ